MDESHGIEVYRPESEIVTPASRIVPALFNQEGERAAFRFVEFFTANIPNDNTRAAYYRAVCRFADWCANRDYALTQLDPIRIAAYIKAFSQAVSIPTVKQHLAAIRMLFDFLVTGGVMSSNPATSVKGPKYKVKQGKTPVLTAEEARALLDAIDTTKIAGLRDRALIGILVYSFARVGAVVAMNVEDYFQKGKRWWIRLHEKGGTYHEMPVHHNAEEYLDAYIEVAGIGDDRKGPLFRALNNKRELTDRRLKRQKVLKMIRRRAKQAGLSETICCHTFRATGITVYLQNGGTLENAQRMAAHASPKTTKLYDRTSDEVTLDEVERIII